MEWTRERVNRLFVLYERYFEQLRADVVAANRLLGSSNPEKTKLEPLTRKEFEALLANGDPESTRRWVGRITLGYEREFPGLESSTANRSRKSRTLPHQQGKIRRTSA